MTDTDRQADRWVTIAEAATILGKSTRTIRRYVAQGKLGADKSKSPMLVRVSDMTDTVADTVADTGGQVADIDRQASDTLRATIQDLERKVDRLAAANDRLEAANDRLQDLLERAEGEVDYLRQALAASMGNQQKLLEAQTGRRSWIERLLPWTRGGENE
jgi:methyl-accepting chemotaxis protein